METTKFITLAGVQWSRENFSKNGETLFTWEEGMKAAKEAGLRLPIGEELEALAALGSAWDYNKKGRWFGKDAGLKSASKESIFLPAAGYREYNDASLNCIGSHGHYWSSTVNETYSYSLYFDSSYVHPANSNHRVDMFSVRCVKNKK
jgi:uncharacterized protein (TIGR02145 family)